MIVIDYNGNGMWSADEIIRRYEMYARKYGFATLRDLRPLVHTENEKQWIYPVMHQVIEGIENGDRACAEIGVEFIEEDQPFPFGRILKSNAARALRRTSLTEEQKERIRKRVVEMLGRRYLPREYRQYVKIVRRIGLGNWLSRIEEQADNPWARRYYTYLKEHASH